MSDFDDSPTTDPDATDILPDDLLEQVVDQDAATPVPEPLVGACFGCTGKAQTITSAAPAPSCVREARAIDRCIVARDGAFALCAGKFLLRLRDFVFYFGVERRQSPEARLPDGVERRRTRIATPRPSPTGDSP